MFVTRLQRKQDSAPFSGVPILLPEGQSYEGRFTFSVTDIPPNEHREGVFTTLGQPISAVSFVREDNVPVPMSSFKVVVSYGPIVAGELIIARTAILNSYSTTCMVEELYSNHIASQYFNSSEWGLRIAFINEGEMPVGIQAFTMVLYS
jgi:hypothetical protein